MSPPHSNRVNLFCGLQFVRLSCCIEYIFSILLYVWWAFNTHLFFNIILLPRWNDISWRIYPTYCCLIFGYTWCAGMVLICMVRCIFSNPGVVQFSYEEILTEKIHRSECKRCDFIRPRKTHHCKTCGVCVRKFDHHCPWINNCVGEDNLWLFTLLIFYALAQSVWMFCTCIYYLWNFTPVVVPQTASYIPRHEYTVICIDTVLSGLFALTMFCQAGSRVIMVLTDTTAFQSVVDENYAKYLPEFQPVHETFSNLFGTNWFIAWVLSPLRRHTPKPRIIHDDDESNSKSHTRVLTV